jgi:hypothetical protein
VTVDVRLVPFTLTTNAYIPERDATVVKGKSRKEGGHRRNNRV